jgi:glycosyltransferase involved in cell wall biosynthesis
VDGARYAAAITSEPVLSLVVPVFCEATHLLDTVATIRREVQALQIPFELILVDDGSTDGTWHCIGQAAEHFAEVTGLMLARNFGKEAAILAGLDAARGQAVIVMDGDLQHPPQLIPELFRRWREDGYDVVNAVKSTPSGTSALHNLARRVYFRLFERLAGVRMADSSDFKLLDRRVVEVLRNLPERNTFFRGLVEWLGFRQTQIGFTVPARSSGQSKFSPFKLFSLAIGSVVSFSTIPLQFVTIAGTGFLVFALALGAQTIWRKLNGDAVEGFTTVILVLLLASSILMIALGIIGEYVANIYREVKRRPRYVVGRRLTDRVPPLAVRPADTGETVPPARPEHSDA